jgi:hypothetical protein
VLAPFAHHGPVRIIAWLERPPATHARGHSRRLYTEEQLYPVTVHMLTRARHRLPPPDGARRE